MKGLKPMKHFKNMAKISDEEAGQAFREFTWGLACLVHRAKPGAVRGLQKPLSRSKGARRQVSMSENSTARPC